MKLSSVVSLTAIVGVLVFGIGYLTFGVVRVGWFKEYTNATMVLTNSGVESSRMVYDLNTSIAQGVS